jgi:hypothetical protein
MNLNDQQAYTNIMHVVLHPGKKMAHFKKYWPKDALKDVLNTIQKKVCHLFISHVTGRYL